jgi:hypothetical protein
VAPTCPREPGSATCGSPVAAGPAPSRFTSPEAYTPRHLAEKVLSTKGALEGERKQVTVLFADLKGSMELLADRDPEEARKLLDPVLERMMDAPLDRRYARIANPAKAPKLLAAAAAMYREMDMQSWLARAEAEGAML